MGESTSYSSRSRPRAQSLFEYRPRTNTDFTISFLEKLISSRTSSNPSTDVAIALEDIEPTTRHPTLRRTLYFVSQPLVAGFLVFPILILFWQAGWNLMVEWLNKPIGQSALTLILLYFFAQSIFLCIYLNQDHLYDYLQKQKSTIVPFFILQCHTFVTASTYIMQWVSMWTIWDRYTSQDWLLMLVVSIAALLAVIALMGHPCDLVCAPFILSYDSIEYNIRIGTPFVMAQMNEYVAHGLNYIFYEFIISLLSILAWRGSYTLLDVFLCPKNPDMSAGLSLSIGYPLYFLLMYTQSISGKMRFLPSFVFLNYPLFIENVRHLMAFFTCVLLWRGFWLLFDTHIATVSLALSSPYFFYLLCMLISFATLSLLRTASSINGPMSHMADFYALFPHYPNCYLIELFHERENSDESSTDSSRSASFERYPSSFLE